MASEVARRKYPESAPVDVFQEAERQRRIRLREQAAYDAGRADGLRGAADRFGPQNFTHTIDSPTPFSHPTPGRYGDSRDDITGHLLQRHEQLTVQRWMRAEADRIEKEARG
jgi:hypothetical protein